MGRCDTNSYCIRYYSRCTQCHIPNLVTESLYASVFLSVKWGYNYDPYFTDEEMRQREVEFLS